MRARWMMQAASRNPVPAHEKQILQRRLQNMQDVNYRRRRHSIFMRPGV